MSKRSVKKAKRKAETVKTERKVKTLTKSQIIWRRIGLGVFFTFGTVIILAASFVVYALLSGNNIDNTKPVSTAKDFMYLYEQNEFERDLPENLVITEKSLTIDTANHTYTITLGLKNNGNTEKLLNLQLFYTNEFESFKKGVKNPLLVIDDDDAMLLTNDIERFSVTGTYYKETDIETLKELLNSIYMEAKLGNDLGRIILPLDTFIE